MILALHHFQLAAPPGCEPRARWFFTEVLGMAEIPKPPELAKRGGCWFQCGEQQLHVGIEREFRPAKKAHPALVAGNIEELRKRLTANGISFEDDHANPGVRRIFAEDPWGNRLEFVEAK